MESLRLAETFILNPALLGKLLFWVCPPLLIGLLMVPWLLLDLGKIKLGWRDLALPLFACAIISLLAYVVPLRQRVQWDESVVYATSLSMHYGQTAHMPVMTVPTPMGQIPVRQAVDKRPPFFPFLGSIFHTVLGPSEKNLFLVNIIVLWVFLSLVSVHLARKKSHMAAFAVPMLVTASPILIWVATSGAIDLLGSVSVLGFLFVTSAYWSRPTPESLLAALLTGLFAAYSRYEVIGIVLPCVLLCAWGGRKDLACLHPRKMLLAFAAFSLFLLPLLAQLYVASNSFSEAGAEPLFSLRNLERNFFPFLQGFFQPGHAPPFNAWLSLAGLVTFLIAIQRKWSGMFTWLAAGASLFQLTLILCYFAGDPLDSVSARLYLLPSLALSLSPLLLARGQNPAQKNALGALVLVVAIALFLRNLERFSNASEIFPASVANNVKLSLDSYFEAQPELVPGRLFISNLDFVLVSNGRPAVSPAFFVENAEIFRGKLASGEIREVVWLRTPADDPMRLATAKESALEKLSHWEELKQERQFPELRFLSWKP